jgi:hypothetical protein
VQRRKRVLFTAKFKETLEKESQTSHNSPLSDLSRKVLVMAASTGFFYIQEPILFRQIRPFPPNLVFVPRYADTLNITPF